MNRHYTTKRDLRGDIFVPGLEEWSEDTQDRVLDSLADELWSSGVRCSDNMPDLIERAAELVEESR